MPSAEAKSGEAHFNPEVPDDFLGVAICKEGEAYEVKLLPEQIEQIRKVLFDLGNVKELLSRKITLVKLGTGLPPVIRTLLLGKMMRQEVSDGNNEKAVYGGV